MQTVTENNFLDRFKIHLNSFQEGFDILSQSNSLEDLAEKFCHILRGNLFVKGVGVYYKKNKDSNWQELFNLKKNNNFNKDTLNNYNYSLNVVDDFPTKGNILIMLPMLDESSFAVILESKLSNESFSNLDKLTVQLFTQLLNNSYQAFQNRRKEKQLIFTLNH